MKLLRDILCLVFCAVVVAVAGSIILFYCYEYGVRSKAGHWITNESDIYSIKCISPTYDRFILVEKPFMGSGTYVITDFNCPIEFKKDDENRIEYDYYWRGNKIIPTKAVFHVKDFNQFVNR